MPQKEILPPTSEPEQQGGAPGTHTNADGEIVLTDRYGQSVLPEDPQPTPDQLRLATKQGVIFKG